MAGQLLETLETALERASQASIWKFNDLRFTLSAVPPSRMAVGCGNQAQGGESHWMEGVLLLAVYLVIGIAFYFLPA
jgi:hypothetical protein